jgi:hypothetical protein
MTRLLLCFPEGARLRGLAGVQLAGRDLQQVAPRRVAILAQHQHLVGGHERDRGGRPRVANHLERGPVAVGKRELVPEQVENLALVYFTGFVFHGGEA